MKKILAALACGIALSSSVSADGLKIEGGAGIWQQKASGDIKYTDTSAALYGWNGRVKADEATNNKGYAWLMIKHPIPIVPNLRVEYVGLESTGLATGTFKKYNVTAGAVATTLLKMEQYDIIPYYNIIDNLGWTTVDVGIDLKVVDASYEANNVQVAGVATPTQYNDSTTVVVPLGYVRARVEFPYGLAVEGIAKYIAYGKSHVIDTIAKVDYTMEFVPVVHPAIEVGYRIQNYKFDDDDEEGTADVTFSGFYAGIMLRY